MQPVAHSTFAAPTNSHLTLPSSASLYNMGTHQISSLKVQKSKSVGNFRQSPTENGQHHSPSDTHAINDNMEEIVQHVVYALTGIEGKYFVKDVPDGGLKVNPKTRVSARTSTMLSRLGEAAYNLERIVAFTDSSSGESPLGLLGQGLVTAIKQELTTYYATVAMIQEQVSITLFAPFWVILHDCCCCVKI